MSLIDSLPQNEDGLIILDPAGKDGDEHLKGTVNPEWFKKNFQELAESAVPLDSSKFETLKSIDRFWAINAEKWRDEGII